MGAILLFVAPALAEPWLRIDQVAGVSVYKRSVPASGVEAVRGVGVVDAPVEKVLWVLFDFDHGERWIDRLAATRVLERRSPHQFVIYRAFRSPFIASDRDVLYENKATRDAKTGVVTVTAASLPHHPDAPPTIGVRAQILQGVYRLTPLEGGKKTRLEIEALFDPKGALPAWVVNWVQRSWPINTMRALRREVARPEIGAYPLPPTP